MLHLCFEFSGLSSQSLRVNIPIFLPFVLCLLSSLYSTVIAKDITVGFVINFGEPYGERQ